MSKRQVPTHVHYTLNRMACAVLKTLVLSFLLTIHDNIGVAGGAVGAPAHPGRRKKIRLNLQGKFVSAPPGGARVNFRTFFAGRGRFGVLSNSFSSFSLCFEGDG